MPKPTEAAQQRGPTAPAPSLSLHPMKGKGRGEGSSLVGARVTHRNAPERIGVILSEVNGQCVVEYTHTPEAGEPFTTPASYPLADLTIV